VKATDSLIGVLEWSEASAEVATWLDVPGPTVIEGVAVGRAIRKWLKAHPTGKPCDIVYRLESAMVPRTPAQETMAKGERTVWLSLQVELIRRGVPVLGMPASL
jgi:hypothetical protein